MVKKSKNKKLFGLLACLAVGGMTIGSISYSVTASAATPYASLKDMKGKKKGIDISAWNKIDWDELEKENLDFVIIKCGSGNTEVDNQWRKSVNECRKRKIPFGVYLYSYAQNTDDARREAEIVKERLSEMNIGSGDLEYPIYYDLEDDSMPHDTQKLQAITDAFMSTLKNAGYNYLGVYANRYWFNKFLYTDYYDQYSKWVAEYDYDVKYAEKMDIWQFTSKGKFSGTDSKTDVNYLLHEPEKKDTDDVDSVTALDTGTAINLNWTLSTNADGYEIYRDSGDGYKKIDDVSKQFYCIDNNTEKGKTYHYKVRSYRTDDQGRKIYATYSAAKTIKKI